MKARIFALIACTTLALSGQALATTATATAASKSGKLSLNGVDYHYQVRGKGEPVLMLHGGLMQADMFAPVFPAFTAAGRQIIAVDLQGHGRSTLGTRPISCEAIADDLAALVQRLGHKQLDVLGYSFGGCVALRLALQHPDRVRRLVLVSTPFADDGWYADLRVQQKQVRAAMAPMMKQTPMYKAYAAVAPRDEFPRLLDAMGEWMRRTYDWSAEVPKLKLPVMLVYGDADMTRPEHEIKFYQLLGGGLKDAGWNRENMPRNRLAIVPDLTHYDMFATARLADTVLPFLNGRMGGKS